MLYIFLCMLLHFPVIVLIEFIYVASFCNHCIDRFLPLQENRVLSTSIFVRKIPYPLVIANF